VKAYKLVSLDPLPFFHVVSRAFKSRVLREAVQMEQTSRSFHSTEAPKENQPKSIHTTDDAAATGIKKEKKD